MAVAKLTLGQVVFAVPFILWRLCRGDTTERGGYITLGLALIFCIAGALYQVRALPRTEIVLILIWSVVIVAFVRLAGRLDTLSNRVLIGGVGSVVLLLGHIIAAIFMMLADAEADAETSVDACS